MKVFVEFKCSRCGAIGEGFRHESEIETEDCWKCGRATYEPVSADDCDLTERPLVMVTSARGGSYKGHSHGHTHHLKRQGDTRTLCGRDASDWLTIDAPIDTGAFCCARCSAKALRGEQER